MRLPARLPRWALWLGWFGGLVIVSAAMLLVRDRLDKAHVALVFLLLVLGGSTAGGRTLGLSLALGSFFTFNYLFLPPYRTFVIADPLDWLVLVAFLVTSIVATQLLYRAMSTAEAATQRAAEVDRLATVGAEALNVARPEDALGAILEVIRATIGAVSCAVYVKAADGGDTISRLAAAPRGADDRSQTRGSGSLVAWIFAHGRGAAELGDGTVRIVSSATQAAGRGGRPVPSAALRLVGAGESTTRTISTGGSDDVRALSIALSIRGETVGVLRIEAERDLGLTPEQARFIDALAYYVALGVERVRLVADAERAESERRLEALRSALLTAVSHDFRTPLTTIKALAHEVAAGGPRDGARVIEEEADRLDSLVGDLLDLSRIHAGAVRPAIELNTVDDLIGAALRRAHGAARGHEIAVDVPQDGLLVGRFDFSQSLRIVVNLVENALKYSPPDQPVTIRARRSGPVLTIGVLDHGPGIPAAERERIFEPFYRPPATPPDVRGTGLGLSIARGLAEAQGGTVRWEPRDGGGSAFVLELPAADAAPSDAGASD
jgi:two-component system, OmpR family, sensor histidine kinase KdpD